MTCTTKVDYLIHRRQTITLACRELAKYSVVLPEFRSLRNSVSRSIKRISLSSSEDPVHRKLYHRF